MIIEIMSREKARNFSSKPHNEKIAVISISDCDKESPELMHLKGNGIIAHFKIHFDDVEKNEQNYIVITDDGAKRIVKFINSIKNETDRLIVHCEAGISRSAGVAAATMKFLQGDDAPIFDNPKYCPNMTCYRKVLNAFYEQQ